MTFKNLHTKALVLLIALSVMALAFVSCSGGGDSNGGGGGGNNGNRPIRVTGVTLNKNTMTLDEGAQEALVATVSPSTATNKDVTWGSSNTGIATMPSGGLVMAVAQGSARITVTTVDAQSFLIMNVRDKKR